MLRIQDKDQIPARTSMGIHQGRVAASDSHRNLHELFSRGEITATSR